MSFWRHNPCVPTWLGTAQAWWSNAPPRLLEPAPTIGHTAALPGLVMTKGTVAHAQEVAQFLSRWFSSSQRARADVPSAVVAAAVQGGRWDIWIVRRVSGEIVGTVVRRWIQDLVIGLARWPRAGVVDFFAVHPAFRARGVGRWLLSTLQASTARPIPPHLILWEGIGTVPPLAWGQLWSLSAAGAAGAAGAAQKIVNPATQVEAWSRLVHTTFLHSAWIASTETTLWQTPAGVVAVQDLYHRSVPEGWRMAMIVAATTPQAVAAFASASPWPLLLADRAWDARWKSDSPFQWVGYNVLAGTVTTSYPCIGL